MEMWDGDIWLSLGGVSGESCTQEVTRELLSKEEEETIRPSGGRGENVNQARHHNRVASFLPPFGLSSLWIGGVCVYV